MATGSNAIGMARVVESVDDVVALMRSQGHRSTHPRRILIQILLDAPTLLSAEELTNRVHRQAPDVSKSTVQRNLNEIQLKGIVVLARLRHG
jgi:Fe2+ or Zn2+ uptake regulation protein